MKASVIVRSKDEADRLRLTVASLAMQTEPPEVIVVNDGSTDHTAQVLAEAASDLDLKVVHHDTPAGRAGAANAGVRLASGEIAIFLDGDTLAGPDFVKAHMTLHRERPDVVARGETWHLRCTRLLQDPETGSPMPGAEERAARLSPRELSRSLVTLRQVREAFDEIETRAQPGVYPGFGPRKLLDLEMEALRAKEDCGLLWMAASGSNQSVSRDAFVDVGGFSSALTINAHRELALRLCQAGLKMVPSLARSYHLNHRSGWRDPLVQRDWEEAFYDAHPIPEVPLMSILWASLSDPIPFPKAACITSLPHLVEAAEHCRGVRGIEEVRAAHIARTTLGETAHAP